MLEPTTLFQVTMVIIAVAALGGYVYAVRSSGRARPENTEAVRTLLETAPYHRLDNIVSKPR